VPGAETAAGDAPEAVEQAPADTASSEPAERAAKTEGPLDADAVRAIVDGYTFETTTLDIGALVNGEPLPEAQIGSRSAC